MSKRSSRGAALSKPKSLLVSTLTHHGAAPQPASGAGDLPGSERPNPVFTDEQRRHAMIEHAAYLLAEHRGFEPGHELEDWCEAERTIDAQLFRGETPAN